MKMFFNFANTIGVINGETALDRFTIGFRLDVAFTLNTFVCNDTTFTN